MSHKRSILMIDRDGDVYHLLASILGMDDCDMIKVESVEAAESVGPVSMTIMDIDGDGDAGAVEHLRGVSHMAHIPLVVVGRSESQTMKMLCFNAGADDYVVKPFSVRELTARIHAMLRRTGA